MSNGVSNKVRTCLWFGNGRAREAAAFYCSLLPGDDSRVERSFASDTERGPFAVVDFLLGGVPYQILDAGPHFTLTEAVSICVATSDQAETDRLWEALTKDGGTESQCGWLKDRYGVSWQIYPTRLTELTMHADAGVAARAMAAMMQQTKIDIAEIEKAAAAAPTDGSTD